MIVVKYLGTMSFEIRGERVDVEFSQEMADLARKLAVNPQLVDRLDVETMTLRRRSHDDTKRKSR